MKYIYHVVYRFSMARGDSGDGSIEITTTSPITREDQIKEISDFISREVQSKSLIITNFILLRTEPVLESDDLAWRIELAINSFFPSLDGTDLTRNQQLALTQCILNKVREP